MVKAIKRYVPPVNPLPKTQPVRTYIKKNGEVVPAHMSKPKFRKGIIVGYKY